MSEKNEIGKVGWIDISVDDADGLQDFYAKVTGWNAEKVDMGDYSDFTMTMPGSGTPSTGICHARGINADLPRQWLIYIVVASADESVAACEATGGKTLVSPRAMGDARFAVIEDPSGAVAGLYQG